MTFLHGALQSLVMVYMQALTIPGIGSVHTVLVHPIDPAAPVTTDFLIQLVPSPYLRVCVPAGYAQVPPCSAHFIRLSRTGTGTVGEKPLKLSAATASSIHTVLTVKHDITANSKIGIFLSRVRNFSDSKFYTLHVVRSF